MQSSGGLTADPIRTLRDERERLREAHFAGLPGLELIKSLAAAMDAAVADLWNRIGGPEGGVALVALGGYGRGELSPLSDVDLMVLHAGARGVRDLSQALFYALWDAGFQVGHATRTIKESLRLAAENVEAETSFLDVRCVAGDTALFDDFREAALARVRRRGGKFLGALAEAVRVRHAEHGRTSSLLEPNLKEGAGGLRDLHAVGWLLRVFGEDGAVSARERADLDTAAELLHRVRSHLHYLTGNRTDVLLLAHQDPAARFLGYAEKGEMPVDAFMRDLYRGARAVEHVGASLFAELTAERAKRAPSRPLGDGFRAQSGLVALDGSPPPLAERPETAVRLFAEAARARLPIARATARWVEEALAAVPGDLPWTAGVASAFFDLLAAGDPDALEAFDHTGALPRLLPEWEHVRCRPQHNVYHRFTVDVHAFQTVANLAALEGETEDELARDVWRDVADRSLLLLAGLLHDIGKGLPGDHSEVGERMALAIADRIGLHAGRRDALAWLVRHHLLLADTATRRDTGDENLVVETAAALGDSERLKMLFLLSVADGRATGPAAWTPWKAALVAELFTKLLRVLERGDLTSREAGEVYRLRVAEVREALARRPQRQVEAHLSGMPRAYVLAFPTAELIRHFALMADPLRAGDVRMHLAKTGERGIHEIAVVASDRPGLFSMVSGALALNRLNILSAQAYTRADGAALEVFRVVGAFEIDVAEDRWQQVADDMRAVLREPVSLEQRIAEKRAAYAARPARGKREPPRVIVDNAASDFSTLVEVHAPDRVGLLYTITSALADLELDIHVSKIATYAEDVVDVFYVRDLVGQKVTEPERIVEIERVILDRLRD